MTKKQSIKNCNTGLKVACFVVSATILGSCNSFNATENQKQIIGSNYWQNFYDQAPVQNTVVANHSFANNSANFADSGVYDLSRESSAGYAASGDGFNSAQLNPSVNTTDGSETALVSSVQTALSSESTDVASITAESPNSSSIVGNHTQVAIASTGEAEIITNIQPKHKPIRIAARPSEKPVSVITQQTAAVESTEQVETSASLQQSQPQNTSLQKTEVASSGAKADNLNRVFRWPVNGRVIADFGPKSDGEHNDGINLAVPEGTPVKSSEDGTVIYSGNELKGYGNLLLIRHNDGWVSAYAHNKDLKVQRGDEVRRGDVVASAGSTGSVKQPQLHFELRKGNKPVNPLEYLPQQ